MHMAASTASNRHLAAKNQIRMQARLFEIGINTNLSEIKTQTIITNINNTFKELSLMQMLMTALTLVEF